MSKEVMQNQTPAPTAASDSMPPQASQKSPLQGDGRQRNDEYIKSYMMKENVDAESSALRQRIARLEGELRVSKGDCSAMREKLAKTEESFRNSSRVNQTMDDAMHAATAELEAVVAVVEDGVFQGFIQLPEEGQQQKPGEAVRLLVNELGRLKEESMEMVKREENLRKSLGDEKEKHCREQNLNRAELDKGRENEASLSALESKLAHVESHAAIYQAKAENRKTKLEAEVAKLEIEMAVLKSEISLLNEKNTAGIEKEKQVRHEAREKENQSKRQALHEARRLLQDASVTMLCRTWHKMTAVATRNLVIDWRLGMIEAEAIQSYEIAAADAEASGQGNIAGGMARRVKATRILKRHVRRLVSNSLSYGLNQMRLNSIASRDLTEQQLDELLEKRLTALEEGAKTRAEDSAESAVRAASKRHRAETSRLRGERDALKEELQSLKTSVGLGPSVDKALKLSDFQGATEEIKRPSEVSKEKIKRPSASSKVDLNEKDITDTVTAARISVLEEDLRVLNEGSQAERRLLLDRIEGLQLLVSQQELYEKDRERHAMEEQLKQLNQLKRPKSSTKPAEVSGMSGRGRGTLPEVPISPVKNVPPLNFDQAKTFKLSNSNNEYSNTISLHKPEIPDQELNVRERTRLEMRQLRASLEASSRSSSRRASLSHTVTSSMPFTSDTNMLSSSAYQPPISRAKSEYGDVTVDPASQRAFSRSASDTCAGDVQERVSGALAQFEQLQRDQNKQFAGSSSWAINRQ